MSIYVPLCLVNNRQTFVVIKALFKPDLSKHGFSENNHA